MQTLPDQNTMYDALMRKDSTFEGIFYFAVKTTGIFCRPTCPARKPKRENVEYFTTSREALQNGYRPCKICQPLSIKGAIPEWLQPLLKEVNQTPDTRFKDSDIKQRGFDPNRVRRWFQKNHGMTFQNYLRTLRICHAFDRIRNGGKVVDAAFDAGYESLSGFSETFKNLTGFSPQQSKHRNLITITRIITPLGTMIAGATNKGICLLEFMDRKMIETQLKRINILLGTTSIPGKHKYLDELKKQLNEYFEGVRKIFEIPLILSGTHFQKSVWKSLQEIPYGSTRSYQEQAESIGNPNAVRAVARANGDNRIAIIIPCHRVIGTSGKLTGYSGGLWRKQFLLDLEDKYSMK